MNHSPTGRIRARLGAPLLVSAALLSAAVVGGCDGEPSEPTPTPSAPYLSDLPPTTRGVLEVVDPKDPERPLYFDFGVVDYGEVIDWEVQLANVGPEPVQLLEALPACGCTVVRGFRVLDPSGEEIAKVGAISKEVPATVPPGGVAVMLLRLASEYAVPNENKLAIVRLMTNSAKQPFYSFEVRFVPERPFLYEPGELRLLDVPTSHGGEGRMKVLTRAKGESSRLVEVLRAPGGLEARVEELVFAGELYWNVFITVPPMTPIGVTRGTIAMSTTNDAGESGRFELPVVVEVTPDVRAEPESVSFGAFPTDEPRSVDLSLSALVPGAKLAIRSTRVEGIADGLLDITPEAIQPDASGRGIDWSVRIEVPAGIEPTTLNGRLVFELDEPFGGGKGELGNELHVPIAGRALVPR